MKWAVYYISKINSDQSEIKPSFLISCHICSFVILTCFCEGKKKKKPVSLVKPLSKASKGFWLQNKRSGLRMEKFRMAELHVGATCKFRERQKCFQLQLSGVVAPVAEEASATAHRAKRRWKNAAKRARKGGFTQRRRGRTPPGQAHHVTLPCEYTSALRFTSSR